MNRGKRVEKERDHIGHGREVRENGGGLVAKGEEEKRDGKEGRRRPW